jgi:Tfp pilus assembly protein PilO
MSALRGSRIWVVGGLLLAVVLTAATYLLVISPAREQAASVRSQVDDASLQQNVLRHRLRDLEAQSQDQGALKTQLAAAQAALPATVDTQGLLRRVQDVATSTATTIANVSIGGAEESVVPDVWAVPVNITMSGSADALVGVLEQLQGDRSRLVTIAGTSLKQSDATTSELTVSVQVYASAPPATAAAAASGSTGAGASAGTTGGTTAGAGGGTTAASGPGETTAS